MPISDSQCLSIYLLRAQRLTKERAFVTPARATMSGVDGPTTDPNSTRLHVFYSGAAKVVLHETGRPAVDRERLKREITTEPGSRVFY